ncbi:MAG TPA: dTDP-glucose 4,6-dehydratase [Tepidisphaeraceae bacterium]|jgi:dTDP-glucose 4,6-dehydratase|nr:dTDP-glucose 4,6-dehydratase [Tepidisphaeraceae bacterium]
MRSILVTGAAGFIGSNFVRGLIGRGEAVKLIAFDKLTYAGNLANIADLLGEQLVFIQGDVCDATAVLAAIDAHRVTEIVHFAAESHVDRSIHSSAPFVQTNVAGTQVLLDAAKSRHVEKFLYVSTDEVYGSLPEDRPDLKFTEETPLQPNSPYSASKAGGDCLVRSYFHTFGMPVLTTRCGNNYGPYQFPEKLIPLFVTNLIDRKSVPLYGDGRNVRDWIHVDDHCDALWAVLNRGTFGQVYNVGGDHEVTNRQITEIVLNEMNCPWHECVRYVDDRPGHDRRYAIDAGKIKRQLGWSPQRPFEQTLRATVAWYRQNENWWRAIKARNDRP